MSQDIALLYVPTSSADEAKSLARGLLQDGFIACANIIPAMQSVYLWDGKVEEGNEAIVILKTARSRLEDLKAEVKKRHSYSVPCILELNVGSINPDYQSWLLKVLEENKI